MRHKPDTSSQDNPFSPEDLKSELDYARYRLQVILSSSQKFENELLEIKSSRAWMAITLYRKLIGLPQRLFRNFFRILKSQVRVSRPLINNRKPPMDITIEGVQGKHVAILTPTFFDFDGNNMFFGGAERYVIELVHLVRELGYDAEVYQCGNSDWQRYYYDIRINGLNVNGDESLLSKKFQGLNRSSVLVIYSPFGLASNKTTVPSIGISHGIYWDSPIHYPAWIHAAKYAQKVITSIDNCTRVVSVDTNTINWVRSTSLAKARNCVYIPNFVDLNQFQPVTEGKNDGRLTVLYPRRLYNPRGFWLISEILPELLHDFPQLDFHFVGKAGPQEEHRVQELVKAFKGRVKWYFLPPEEMHIAYQKADIVLIPTLHSEGTSLSCLEALASGNAVIATNVGGLPDLIFNRYNGLLVEPDAVSLQRALSLLCEDEHLRQQIQMNGRAVAEVFSIQRWRSEWRRQLADFLPKRETKQNLHQTKFAVVVPPIGVEWKSSPLGVAQKAALDLAACGYETYWINPGDRSPDPAVNLHIVAQKDDLYLSNPLLFLFSGTSQEWVSRLGSGRIVYQSEHEPVESLEGLINQLKA